MRRSAQVLLALALAVACGALVCNVLHDPNDRLMSDDELIALFHDQRASFDSLVIMLDEDAGIEMSTDYGKYGLKEHVDADRQATYTRLFRRIRCGKNVWNKEDGILFQQYVNKFAPNVKDRWMRGYWYARKPIKGTVKSTDLVALSTWGLTAPGIVRYRPLEPPWYIYSCRGYTD